MQVHFCGVRGSTPAPGREFLRYGGHTACVALAHDDAPAPTLILDAGIGLQTVPRLLRGAPFAGTILLSHLHWDHLLGLPFFGAGDHPDSQVTVLMPEQDGARDASELLAAIMRPPYFPITPDELGDRWRFATVASGELVLKGFTVLARRDSRTRGAGRSDTG